MAITQNDHKKRLVDFETLKFEIRDTMRYDDVGDYFDNTIVAYNMGDDIIHNAIFLHEFIEFALIKSAGIEPSLIDKFDTDETYQEKYPKEYELYGKFHDLANKIEKQFIENLGCSWDEHDRKVYMTKVKTAVQNVTKELHNDKPDQLEIENSKKVIEKTFG